MKEKIRKEKEKRPAMHPLMWIVFIVLAIYAVTLVGMLLWGFMTTLRSGLDYDMDKLGFPKMYIKDANGNPIADYLYPKEDLFGLNYYRSILFFKEVRSGDYSYYSIFGYEERPAREISFLYAAWNSVFYAVIGALVYTFVCMTVAYLCSKYRYKFSSLLMVVNLVAMTIPIVGSQPSMIDFMQKTGLYDSYLGMLLQKFAFMGMYFFVFKAFFDGIADSYVEAAEIDGASQLACYLRIMVPLAAKMFGTVFMLQFITLWNDYQTPLLYFPSHMTLSYAVYQVAFVKSQGTVYKGIEWTGVPQKIASCMLLAIPMIIIFVIFNRKIVGDISIGGLKE